LIENPDDAVQFLKRIRDVAVARDIFIDLADVENLTPDAVALLLATITAKDIARNTWVSGNLPKKAESKIVLLGSGFREYVKNVPESAGRLKIGKIRKRTKRGDAEHLQSRVEKPDAISRALVGVRLLRH
jgi:hypothetical protein